MTDRYCAAIQPREVFSVCYLKDRELIAVETINHSKDYMAARKLIADRALMDLDKLPDPNIPLKEVRLMPHIVFFEPGGARREINASVGITVMETAVSHGVQGIVAQCGGACACATCHVYVAPAWFDKLPPREEMEEGMLECAWGTARQQPPQLPDHSHLRDGWIGAHGPAATRWLVMFGLAVHGGAGTLPRQDMSPQAEENYRSGLEQALTAGYALLESGASSVDAVTAAVVALENNPLFNAGRGAVFTLEGRNELDASIMEGHGLKAGAVCGLTQIKNPVELAKAVMQRSEHVMLAGSGAEEFAQSVGFEFVPQSYFYTEARWNQLQRIRGGDTSLSALTISHIGTVGAVALRCAGSLGRRHVHGRHDRQALSPDRRFSHHRRGDLCG